jgi:beta-N-acetylhexosaminidase
MMLRDSRRRIGQLAVVGFSGHAVTGDLRALAREFDLGGVVLFARNVAGPDQVADLNAEIRSLARDVPLWVAVDQEGGRVARLRRPFTEWPPMRTLGRSGDDRLTERFACALAAELREVGFNWDFAPVMDVDTNPANPVIGDRALDQDPGVVARLGRLIIRTLQAAGVAACAKHFPGHGDTSTDSHHTMPVLDHTLDRLRAVEFLPFRAAVEEQVAGIMTAHVLIPAVDGERPATLSSAIVDGWLRRELNHSGLAVSDDLGMRAISDRFALPDAMLGAILAGCDVALLCGTDASLQAAALERVVHATEDGTLPARRVEDALRRQRAVKARFLRADDFRYRPPAPGAGRVVGCEAHQAVAEEMERHL